MRLLRWRIESTGITTVIHHQPASALTTCPEGKLCNLNLPVCLCKNRFRLIEYPSETDQ